MSVGLKNRQSREGVVLVTMVCVLLAACGHDDPREAPQGQKSFPAMPYDGVYRVRETVCGESRGEREEYPRSVALSGTDLILTMDRGAGCVWTQELEVETIEARTLSSGAQLWVNRLSRWSAVRCSTECGGCSAGDPASLEGTIARSAIGRRLDYVRANAAAGTGYELRPERGVISGSCRDGSAPSVKLERRG